MIHKYKGGDCYLWQHGIDLKQDAVIEAAIYKAKQITGAKIDPNTMLKMIIMKVGENLTDFMEANFKKQYK